jgi:hypothetical protein
MNPPAHYPTLAGDGPFAKAYNERQSKHWVATGNYIEPLSCALAVLQDDYDKRHSVRPDDSPGLSKTESAHHGYGG